MTSVTFETALIADCLRKANAIAPTRGKNAAQFAGFFCEIRPDADGGGSFILRCTNNEVFYTEQIEVIKIEGIDQDWRLPSIPLNGVITNLPMGSGRQVTLRREVIENPLSETGYSYSNRIFVESGRTKASMLLIPTEDYPNWDVVDTSNFNLVQGFGDRIDQVAWAVAQEGGEPLTGVHINGEQLVATNRFKIAVVDTHVNLGESDPVTVPMQLLGPILKQIVDVRLAVVGNFLYISPNEYTQIKCGVYAMGFPDVSKKVNRQCEKVVILDRDEIQSCVSRVLSIGATDRQLSLDVTVGNEEMAFYVEGESKTETAEDAVSLKEQAVHEPVSFRFSPQYFLEAVGKSPSAKIVFHYDVTTQKTPVKFASDSYSVVVAPRAKPKEG